MSGLGIFGGTFDPVHHGHLRLAEEVADALGLTEVRLLPAAVPPHRAAPLASPDQRLAMVRLAVAGNPRLVADGMELERVGPSYTIDTLAQLRLDDRQAIFLLLGSDAFRGLPSWHRWRELFDLAHLVVVARPEKDGWRLALPPELAQELRRREGVVEGPAGGIVVHPAPLLDISSTSIRAMLACGHSPRYLLPQDVLDYIGRNNLYRYGGA